MLEYNRMRLVFQDVMLTRDNLKRRKWQGDSRSSFCDCEEEESIQHFLDVPYLNMYGVLVLFWELTVHLNLLGSMIFGFYSWFLRGKQFQMVGPGGICWAIGKKVKPCILWKQNHQISYRYCLLVGRVAETRGSAHLRRESHVACGGAAFPSKTGNASAARCKQGAGPTRWDLTVEGDIKWEILLEKAN